MCGASVVYIADDVICIEPVYYQAIAGCNDAFDDSNVWDQANGLDVITRHSCKYSKLHTTYIQFEIVDPKRFMLAKIKHGL